MSTSHQEILVEMRNRIYYLRASKGMSPETLAEKAGLSRSQVLHVESGKRTPSISTLLALADALGTDPGFLLGKPKPRARHDVVEPDGAPK